MQSGVAPFSSNREYDMRQEAPVDKEGYLKRQISYLLPNLMNDTLNKISGVLKMLFRINQNRLT